MSSTFPTPNRRDEAAPDVETHSTNVNRAAKAGHVAGDDAGATSVTATAGDLGLDRRAVVDRQQESYGGIKVGSAFFGWLTATGTAVLLTALVAAAGTAVGVATNTDAGKAVSAATNSGNAATIGIAGGIVVLVILFVAYYCGGYVAGRMARFSGLRQGIAVWVWALVIAVVVAILAAVAGTKYDVLSKLNAFPRISVAGGSLTTGGLIALVAAALASLLGAMLGGLAGMRFHRNVDKAGLGR